jgi:hypothetical protein
MNRIYRNGIFAALCSLGGWYSAIAQTDTLRVMAYNVLNYGSYPLCQGANGTYNAYLQTIVGFSNPDIIGLEKMGSLRTGPTDFNFTAAIGFQDTIKAALNAVFPGRFNYCPNTNLAGSGTECLVLYNQQKLGYLGITCTYANTEDFNTHKFFYLDPNLTATHDTTFLYVTDNHVISGSSNYAARGAQIVGEMNGIKAHFSHLPNMINMGDFNIRNSSEPLYQTLTNPVDTNFRFYDPPFHPDGSLSTPADWDSNPVAFAAYLTTSTRRYDNVPNNCGTSGGGKDWYDHIFLSPWIVNSANYISYIPHSFRVIGNDGHRVGISVNDAPANTSVPSAVADALFQMSNKYPVMVDLLVTPNTTGSSLPDPEIIPSAVASHPYEAHEAAVVNPVREQLALRFSSSLMGTVVTVDCIDMTGRTRLHNTLSVDREDISLNCPVQPGIYFVRVMSEGKIINQSTVTKY